jgi:hypothetical protein
MSETLEALAREMKAMKARIQALEAAAIEAGIITPDWDYALIEAARGNKGPLIAIMKAGKIPGCQKKTNEGGS